MQEVRADETRARMPILWCDAARPPARPPAACLLSCAPFMHLARLTCLRAGVGRAGTDLQDAEVQAELDPRMTVLQWKQELAAQTTTATSSAPTPNHASVPAAALCHPAPAPDSTRSAGDLDDTGPATASA